MVDFPEIGTVWQDAIGGQYHKILDLVYSDDNQELRIIYQLCKMDTGKLVGLEGPKWDKSVSMFMRYRRFIKVDLK